MIQHGSRILEHDDATIAEILLKKLQEEGIEFMFNADVDHFISAKKALVRCKDGSTKEILFDAVFVGIGRAVDLNSLQLSNAGIEVKDSKIVKDKYLRTTNKNVYVCGDVAGDLMFSHTAEFHAHYCWQKYSFMGVYFYCRNGWLWNLFYFKKNKRKDKRAMNRTYKVCNKATLQRIKLLGLNG